MNKTQKLHIGRAVMVVLAMLIQLLWLFEVIWRLSNYYTYLSWGLNILGSILVLYIVNKRDNPSYKLAWTVLILSVPIFGSFIYLMFGRAKLTKRTQAEFEKIYAEFDSLLKEDKTVREKLEREDLSASNQSGYIRDYAAFPLYENTSTEYYKQGEELFEQMKSELEKAEKFIFMEYFSIQEGVVWDSILEILERKAKSGVEVRVIYDDMGCVALLPGKYYKKLSEKGIKCTAFNPFMPVLSVIMNNRDHRKITVIDGKIAFTGGMNLCDEYVNAVSPYGHWKDAGIKLEGDAVWSLTAMFLQMWNAINNEDKDYAKFMPDCRVKLNTSGFVQPYCDTPLDHEIVGEQVYVNIINKAKKYVYIYTPYLIIDNEMMQSLCLAAKSGIDVRIVTPGIPDKKLVFLLTQSYYSQLIDSGVKIYQYTPGFIHSKCFVSDDETATIGTINMDYRSLYLHFECGVWLYKSSAVMELKEDMLNTFNICQEITKEFCNKNVFVRIVQSVLRLIAPLL